MFCSKVNFYFHLNINCYRTFTVIKSNSWPKKYHLNSSRKIILESVVKVYQYLFNGSRNTWTKARLQNENYRNRFSCDASVICNTFSVIEWHWNTRLISNWIHQIQYIKNNFYLKYFLEEKREREELEASRPCRENLGECMEWCGETVRKLSNDCPSQYKQCCVLVN